MTFRAVVLGLLGALFIAGAGFINDNILRLTPLVGNHLPISVFGVLILLAMLGNPILYTLRRSWRFRPQELAVSVGLMLVASSIPGSSLMRYFTPVLIMPTHLNRSLVGWQKTKVLDYVPPAMMPDVSQDYEGVLGKYLGGMGHGGMIGLGEVPWEAWGGPLSVWVPLVVLMFLGVVCLSLIVHRQWASRERLRYPIADFASSIMSQDPDRRAGPIFRNRLFWIGLVVILAIRLVNGTHVWYPQFFEVPLHFDFTMVAQKWPFLTKVQDSGALLKPILFPTAVAFSFFLASDVALSLGISQILSVLVGCALVVAGINIRADWLMGGAPGWQHFGSYFGVALLLIYMGRRYYWCVLKQALTFFPQEGVEPYAAWACRFFLLACAGMVGILTVLGLDWPLAVLTVLLIMMLFLVMARILSETGLFFIQPAWVPIGAIFGFFGAAALGPEAGVIIGMVCLVLIIDPRECLMPFMVTVLKIADDHKIKTSHMGWGSVGVLLAGLAVAFPVVIWANYNYGAPVQERWAMEKVPKMNFNQAEKTVRQLTNSGELEQSEGFTAWERIKNIHPERHFLAAAGIGVALVLILSILRLRFVWWPLHPVLFLVWNTYPMTKVSASFLLGWFIKTVVTRLGGAQKYHQIKPLMIGAIAGDLLGGLIFMVHGALYYYVYDLIPKQFPPEYQIFPG